MTTQAIARRRRPRGLHPRRTDRELQQKRLPEYLNADEADAVIRAAEDPRAKLLMLTQWWVPRAAPDVVYTPIDVTSLYGQL